MASTTISLYAFWGAKTLILVKLLSKPPVYARNISVHIAGLVIQF